MNIRSVVPASALHLGASLLSVRRKIIFEAELDQLSDWPAKIPATFRPGTAADLERFDEHEYDYDPSAKLFAQERLAAQDQLVVGESDGKIVYYGWLMFGQLDLGTRRYVSLPSDTVYSYRLFTVSAQRRKGLFAAYYSFLGRTLRARGFRRILAWVEAGNSASLRAHDVIGLRRIGSVWHFRILFRSYFLVPRATRARLQWLHRVPASGRATAQVSHD